jgi:glycosyltransferase involved in cell wall biosynthesis
VERKGHAWFIEHVMQKLPNEYIYLIAGQGPQEESIRKLIQKLELKQRVLLLGSVSEEEKNCLYQLADLFVMPNIKVKNDQEGFGIVILEAGSYGLPVIASNTEGVSDAVIHGKTGPLIDEKNAQGFIEAIQMPTINRSTLGDIVASSFGWKYIIKQYYEEFEKIMRERSNGLPKGERGN